MPSKMNRFWSKLLGLPPDPPVPAAPPVSSRTATLRDQMQQFLAGGQADAALLALQEAGYADAVLLKTQLDSARTQYEARRLSYADWSQLQARVNYAILHLVQPEQEEAPLSLEPMPEIPLTEQARSAIQDLIQKNRTEEALEQCAGLGVNFLLTHKRFQQGKEHRMLGLMSEEEWIRLQKQVEEALLYFLAQHPVGPDLSGENASS